MENIGSRVIQMIAADLGAFYPLFQQVSVVENDAGAVVVYQGKHAVVIEKPADDGRIRNFLETLTAGIKDGV